MSIHKVIRDFISAEMRVRLMLDSDHCHAQADVDEAVDRSNDAKQAMIAELKRQGMTLEMIARMCELAGVDSD